MPAITYMLLRLLSKPWPIVIISIAVVVKEKSLFDSAAPEKKEDTIFFLQNYNLQ
jgi:hypothetical protein